MLKVSRTQARDADDQSDIPTTYRSSADHQTDSSQPVKHGNDSSVRSSKNNRKLPRRASETAAIVATQTTHLAVEEDEPELNSDQFMRERQRLRHERLAQQRKLPRRKPPRRASVGTSTQEDHVLPTGPECPVHGISFDMMPLARLLADSKHFHSEPEFGGCRDGGEVAGRRFSLQSTRSSQSMPAVGGRRRTLAAIGCEPSSDHHLSSTLSVKQISGSATSSDNDPGTAVASGSTTITPISGESTAGRSRQRLSSLPTPSLGGGSSKSPTSSMIGVHAVTSSPSAAGNSTSPRPKRPRGRAASSTAFMFTMRSSSRESENESDLDKLSTRAHDGKHVAYHGRRRQSDTPLYRVRRSPDNSLISSGGGNGGGSSFADSSTLHGGSRRSSSSNVSHATSAKRSDVTSRHGREPLAQIPSEERPSDVETGKSNIIEETSSASVHARTSEFVNFFKMACVLFITRY